MSDQHPLNGKIVKLYRLNRYGYSLFKVVISGNYMRLKKIHTISRKEDNHAYRYATRFFYIDEKRTELFVKTMAKGYPSPDLNENVEIIN